MNENNRLSRKIVCFLCFVLIFSFLTGCTDSLTKINSTESDISSSNIGETTEPVGTVDYTETDVSDEVITTVAGTEEVIGSISSDESDPISETYIESTEISETKEMTTEESATVAKENNPKFFDKLKNIGEKAKTPKPQGEAFFNDAVFVGDSVTMGLRNYVTNRRNNGYSCLGNAKFLCAGSMGWGNTLKPIGTANSIHPKYKGKEVTVAEGVKLIGAKKVFILLGINDIAAYSNSKTLSNISTLIGQIEDANPGVKIYIESITPIIASKEKGRLSNQCIDELNEEIKDLCKENGWTYVNVSSCLKDSNNCLVDSYCSDPNDQGIHMAYSGCKQWVDYLVNHF